MRPLAYALLALCLLTTTASAATFVVRPDGTGDFPTIQAAIDACVDGDIVELADGTYTGDGNRDIEFLGKTITVRSQSLDPELCIIDCEATFEDMHRAFWIHDSEGPDAVIEGIKITRGYAPQLGGAIYIYDASPTLRHCVFADNKSWGRGGGVAIQRSSTAFIDCSFIGNTADNTNGNGVSGGLSIQAESSPTVTGCHFIGNFANWAAGGMGVDGASSVQVDDCTFIENVTPDWGGGFASDEQATIDFRNCTFIENHAGLGGGGMLAVNSQSSWDHCVFYFNSTDDVGGAVLLSESATATLTSCTLALNSALTDAVGVYDAGTSIELVNTIVALSPQGGGVGGDGSFALSCCDVYGNAGGDYEGPIAGMLGVDGNISENPWFCDAGNEDFSIVEYSACAPDQSPGECGLIGAWPVGCVTVGVPDHAQVPLTRALLQNHPNPFNPSTTITYTLPAASRVTLQIYDLAGRLVRQLQPTTVVPSGEHAVTWDGLDDRGQGVSSGVYFYRIDADDWSESRSMVLVR